MSVVPPPISSRTTPTCFSSCKQRRRRACERLEDDALGLQSGALDALEHVGDEARAAGDDVRVDFQAAAGHADRIVDALLAVNGEIARQRVDDLAVAGEIDDLARVDHAPDVARGDFAVVARNGDDGTVVRAADVVAGDADENFVEVDPGHALGLFGCRLDRFDRLVEVDDDALAHSQGRRFADADDFEPGGAVDGNDRTGLGRSDIEPAHGLVLHPLRHTCPSQLPG